MSVKLGYAKTVGDLVNNHKLAINLLAALNSSAFVVYSTAGLDPTGIKLANSIVSSATKSGIHMFSCSLSPLLLELDLIDDVVVCGNRQ